MPSLDRERLLADRSLTGRTFCAAYTRHIDDWLGRLFEATEPPAVGISLVAVGGHGRSELTPCSDLDLLLISDLKDADTTAKVADGLWYPIWDEGLKLGHAVRGSKECLTLAADDLETATALLTTRHIAGDPRLSAGLAERAAAQWRKRRRRFTEPLADSVAERHGVSGEVAFDLEPELKEGRGGLRDLHALTWAEAMGLDLAEVDLPALRVHYDTLLSTRIELHRVVGRATDRLHLQDQDAVAARLGLPDADALMHQVATAAREIAWASDEFWYGVRTSAGGSLARRRSPRTLNDGLTVRECRVALGDEARLPAPFDALKVGVAAAETGLRIAPSSLRRLADAPAPAAPWLAEERDLLVRLLRCGVAAIPVIEALDRAGLWVRYVPEWDHTRSRPQRNAYHRFTVDRHLLEASAEAARLASNVARPDLLVLGALLHDIGKGLPGDHTAVGVELVAVMGPRMGFGERDTGTLVEMVAHHLLLPDVATRRDLDDPATIDAVALAVGDTERLELLTALTEADSLATGPSAWGSWKAGLVAELSARVRRHLEGADPFRAAAAPDGVPAAGEPRVVGERDRLTVVSPDRVGMFARVAGVLALHGLDVLEASAGTEAGMAVETFRVGGGNGAGNGTGIRWDRVCADVEKALAGRLAISARLAERARTYRSKPSNAHPLPAVVRFDNEATDAATVLEVVGQDRVGLLHEITRTLAEFDLDIVTAKIATVGSDVVDTFYVRDVDGAKITDPDHQEELTRALRHVVDG